MEGKHIDDEGEDKREREHSFKSFFPTNKSRLNTPSPSSTVETRETFASSSTGSPDPYKYVSSDSLFDSPQNIQPTTQNDEHHQSTLTQQAKHEKDRLQSSPQNLLESTEMEDSGMHMQLQHSPYKSPRDAFPTLITSDSKLAASSVKSHKVQTGVEPSKGQPNRRTTSEDDGSPPDGSEFYFCFKLNTFDSEEEIFSQPKKEKIKDLISESIGTGASDLPLLEVPTLSSQPPLDSSAAKHRIAMKKKKCRVAAESPSTQVSQHLPVMHDSRRHHQYSRQQLQQQQPLQTYHYHHHQQQHHHHQQKQQQQHNLPYQQQLPQEQPQPHHQPHQQQRQLHQQLHQPVKRLYQQNPVQPVDLIIGQQQQPHHHHHHHQHHEQKYHNVGNKEIRSSLPIKDEYKCSQQAVRSSTSQQEKPLGIGISPTNSFITPRSKGPTHVTETDIDSVLNTRDDTTYSISSKSNSASSNQLPVKSVLKTQQITQKYAHYNLPQFSHSDKIQNTSNRLISEPHRPQQDVRSISTTQRYLSSHTTQPQSIPTYQPHFRQSYQTQTLPQPSNSNPNISSTQQHSDSDQFSENDIWQKKPPGSSFPQAKKKRAIPIGAKTNPLHTELIKEVSSTFKHNVAASSCSLDELEMPRNDNASLEFINQPQSPFALIPPSKLVKGLTAKRSLTCVSKKPKSAGSNEETSSELAQMFDKFRRKKIQSHTGDTEGEPHSNDSLSKPDSQPSDGEKSFSGDKTSSQPILNSNDSSDPDKNHATDDVIRSKHLSLVDDDRTTYYDNEPILRYSESKPSEQKQEVPRDRSSRSSRITFEETCSQNSRSQYIQESDLSQCPIESKTLPRLMTNRCESNQQQKSAFLPCESRLKQPERLINKPIDRPEIDASQTNPMQRNQCRVLIDPRSCFNRSRSFSEESYIRDSLKLKELSLDNDSKDDKRQSFLRYPTAINPSQQRLHRQYTQEPKQFTNPCKITTNGVTSNQQRATVHQPFVQPSQIQHNQEIKHATIARVGQTICKDQYSCRQSSENSSHSYQQKPYQIYRYTSVQPSTVSTFNQPIISTIAPKKRDFPQPVQQEPAWFALARRKSKEWSEKQII